MKAFERKAKLQKSESAKLASILAKILLSEDDFDKFAEISDLSTLDLDFDAYVFIKILALNTEETAEDVDAIKKNVLTRLKENKSELANLMYEIYINKFSNSFSVRMVRQVQQSANSRKWCNHRFPNLLVRL